MNELERREYANKKIQDTPWPDASVWVIESWMRSTNDNTEIVEAAMQVSLAGGQGGAIITMYLSGELRPKEGSNG